MNRLNKILIGLAAVQLVLVAVLLTRDDQVRIAPMRPILVEFDPATVTRIQVFDKNADKPAIDVVKAGDGWALASGFGHPVDATKVIELTGKLAGLKSRGPIATTAVRQTQLAVGDTEFQRKLIVTTPRGDTTLLVGNADAGRTTAVRIGGDPRVFGVTGLTSWNVEINPARWIEPTYLELDREQLSRIVVQGAGGVIELDRGAAGWQLTTAGLPVVLGSGETLDTAAVDKLVGEAASIAVFAPGDPKRDATTPTATISLWLTPADPAGSGTESADRPPDHVLDVILDGDNYWVHDRARPTAAMVGKAGLQALVEVTRATLVSKPPAPAPGPGPGPGKTPAAKTPAPRAPPAKTPPIGAP